MLEAAWTGVAQEFGGGVPGYLQASVAEGAQVELRVAIAERAAGDGVAQSSIITISDVAATAARPKNYAFGSARKPYERSESAALFAMLSIAANKVSNDSGSAGLTR